MNIRRPVAALFVALALVGGPATMTACSAAGGGLERNDGDSSDNETANTGGSDQTALAGKLNGLKVADEIKGVWKEEVERLVAAGKLKDGEVKALVA